MRISVIYASREPNRAAVLIEGMRANGMGVTVCQKFKELAGLISNAPPDLLLIGARLADEDGMMAIKSLRSRGHGRQVPIVAVVDPGEEPPGPSAVQKPSPSQGTAWPRGLGHAAASPEPLAAAPPAVQTISSNSVDRTKMRLSFFQAGADECLSLNWDVAECLARIKAVLRRTQQAGAEEVIKMGPITLNLTSYTLYVGGKLVPLTSKELDLLYVFLSSSNRVLSRPYLIERVWGYNYFGSPRTVDVHVRRLREKLGAAAKYITTIPCVGYKLVPPPEPTGGKKP